MDRLTPADPDELADLLARRPAEGRSLLPTGAGGTPPAVRRAADEAAAGEAADVLSTASLAGLRELRPRDLTVAAGGGTRVPDLLAALAGEGVWVPLGGPALGMSAGGLAATAPAGPFDQSYGDLKRQLLACGLAGWDGQLLRWGRAVMKDVAGYSMVRSVAGAFGRTGVLHRVTFRLWPAPEAMARPVVAPENGDGAPDPLAVAGALATSDADASVRPDAAVWSWSPAGPDGGRLEVRLVGTEASVSLRLEKLREWAAGRGAGLEGGEPEAFDPLAAGGATGRGDDAADDRTDGGRADAPDGATLDGATLDGEGQPPGLPAAGAARDPRVSLVAVRTGRSGFDDAARRARRALGERSVGLEAYPMAGHLRCAYRREDPEPDDAASGSAGPSAIPSADPSAGPDPSGPFARLLEAVGDARVRVERGSAAELAAADARRSEEARRLEGRVLDELEGRPRHWLSAYL